MTIQNCTGQTNLIYYRSNHFYRGSTVLSQMLLLLLFFTTLHLAFIAQCNTNKHFIVCLGKTVHKRIRYDCLSNKKLQEWVLIHKGHTIT